MEGELEAALDLMRRMPPQNVHQHLQDIIDLQPELCDSLLSAVDQPLKVARDASAGRDYLLCDYNRDENSYRSPWSNVFDPPLEDSQTPSDRLRKLEVQMNEAFDTYRQMYFDGGVSSVYLWDSSSGFNGAVLIKKSANLKTATGCWDSIHVIEVQEKTGGRAAAYKMTSSVMLWLKTSDEACGMFNLGGYLSRQEERERPLTDDSTHITNIGPMIEEIETRMRTQLNDVYFGTSRNIIDSMRSITSLAEDDKRVNLMREMNSVLGNKAHTSADN
jgi:capping protein beta